jgi:ribosomal protein S18 acetylase RimI-like enzyme
LNDIDKIALVDFDACHLGPLVAMWRASFESAVGVIAPNPVESWRQYFVDQVLPSHDVRIAMFENELVGFVASSSESIAQLYVRIGNQRRGVGTQLLDWAKERSGGSLWLYTFARNLGARAFYERRGFVPIAHGVEPLSQLEDVKYQWLRGARHTG